MPTAEELLVAIRSEGVDETRGDLEGVEQSMENTAETAGDSAEQLEGFSEQFQGAMTAAVAALAVGVAGLASQVPVLGGLFSGVKAVVSAVAFQMDQVLRPVLQPLTQGFFKLSGAIMDMDGAAGDAIGIVASIVSAIIGIGAAVGAVAVQIFGFSTVWGAVSSAVGTAVSAIVGFIGGIPLAIAAAIAAVVGFAAAYLTNFRGVRDATNRIVSDAISFIVNGFKSVTSDLAKWASDLAGDMYEWGKQAIQRFIDGLKSLIDRVRNLITDLGADVRVALGGDATLNNGGGGDNVTTFNEAVGAGSYGADAQIDGRQLSESTGRYRADPSRRRNI